MKRPSILFICIGNACRSQMAEGFARAYGRGEVEVSSAGTMPMLSVPAQTRKVMLEKNLPIDEQYPKGIELFRGRQFDAIINMSGSPLTERLEGRHEDWLVADPYGRGDGAFRQVRDEIENRVMQLLLRLRRAPSPEPPASGPGPVRKKLRG